MIKNPARTLIYLASRSPRRRELLKQIVRFVETRRSPLDPNETVEIIGFIEAALQSSQANGQPRPVRP